MYEILYFVVALIISSALIAYIFSLYMLNPENHNGEGIPIVFICLTVGMVWPFSLITFGLYKYFEWVHRKRV